VPAAASNPCAAPNHVPPKKSAGLAIIDPDSKQPIELSTEEQARKAHPERVFQEQGRKARAQAIIDQNEEKRKALASQDGCMHEAMKLRQRPPRAVASRLVLRLLLLTKEGRAVCICPLMHRIAALPLPVICNIISLVPWEPTRAEINQGIRSTSGPDLYLHELIPSKDHNPSLGPYNTEYFYSNGQELSYMNVELRTSPHLVLTMLKNQGPKGIDGTPLSLDEYAATLQLLRDKGIDTLNILLARDFGCTHNGPQGAMAPTMDYIIHAQTRDYGTHAEAEVGR